MTLKLNDRQTYLDCREQLERALGFCLDADVKPETTRAIAEFVLGMCKVSNQRREEYRDEPWMGIAPQEHLSHAWDHAFNATLGSIRLVRGKYFDSEGDNLPHVYHAALRMAFADYLLREEEDNK